MGVTGLPGATEEGAAGEGEGGEPKKEIIPPEVLEDMRNIFSVFDIEGTGEVSILELRTILRALDQDPIEEELEMLSQKLDPEEKGSFTYQNLYDIMEDKLKERDTYDDLIIEFKKLDKDQDGRIPNPEFKQFMMNMGTKFTLE